MGSVHCTNHFARGQDLMPGFNFPSFVYHRVVKLSFYNNRGNVRAETVEPTERIANWCTTGYGLNKIALFNTEPLRSLLRHKYALIVRADMLEIEPIKINLFFVKREMCRFPSMDRWTVDRNFVLWICNYKRNILFKSPYNKISICENISSRIENDK